jgi:hypothetical protein
MAANERSNFAMLKPEHKTAASAKDMRYSSRFTIHPFLEWPLIPVETSFDDWEGL